MKLLVTTATAALLSAGIAYAGDATSETSIHAGAPKEGAVAESTITTDLDAAPAVDTSNSVHVMTDLDSDASGDISLYEAQEFDPSITEESFAEYDANADGMLDADEYAYWETEMDSSMRGQGDADLLNETTPRPEPAVDSEGNFETEAGVDMDADTGLDGEFDATDDVAPLNGDIHGGATGAAGVEGSVE